MTTKKVTTIAREGNKPRVTYSDELFIQLIDKVAAGQSVSKICTGDAMPTRKSFFEWLKGNPERVQLYAYALDMRADVLAEDIIIIADERPSADSETGKMDSAWVQWQKNRIDARKWTASKLKPKKYGERLGIGGADDLPPVQVDMSVDIALEQRLIKQSLRELKEAMQDD